MPAKLAECIYVTEIACLVFLDFCGPPFRARSGDAERRAVLMPVPKAAMDEDDGAVFRQDEVGFAGEGAV
jgi:hypothetical protein